MLWKLSGQLYLEDILPVPKKMPGRHFSTSYHILGNATKSYDEKYAQMKYGEHYRQKILAQIEQERQRCDSIVAKEKKRAAILHRLATPEPAEKASSPWRYNLNKLITRKEKKAVTLPTLSTPDPVGSSASPRRYDLNELRHHQRRCAALLFGARERGSHELPMLVRWAPKRRESYYLMSERVYNDRLMLMLRNKEAAEAKEDSPLCFDFLDNEGDTDDLHDLQKFIQKTSKDISGLNFDTKYKDYSYEFNDKTGSGQEGTSLGMINDDVSDEEKLSSNAEKSNNARVTFSDDFESESDRTRQNRRCRRLDGSTAGEDNVDDGLDPSGIEIGFGTGAESSISSSEESQMMTGEQSDNRRSMRRRKKDLENSLVDDGIDKETDEEAIFSRNQSDQFLDLLRHSDVNSDGSLYDNLHGNKHCRHLPGSLKKKSQEYYKNLPKLLKTSELREKLPGAKYPKNQELGKTADHSCMQTHRTAYNRALALARFRSLSLNYSFLESKTTSPFTFSYFPGPRNSAVEVKEKDNVKKRKNKKIPISGPSAIFGDIDMNDFYNEKDELLYYIKPEELKTVLESVTTGSPVQELDTEYENDSDDEDDEDTHTADTTTVVTSKPSISQMNSSLDDAETEVS